MRGTFKSKCDCRGTEIAEREDISEVITSGEVGSAAVEEFPACAPERSFLRRLARSEDWTGASGVVAECCWFSARSMVTIDRAYYR